MRRYAARAPGLVVAPCAAGILLLGLFVRGVLAALLAVLLKLNTASGVGFALECDVVLAFALGALHCDVYAHGTLPQSQNYILYAGPE
jgi:hypothetical protein